MHAGIIRFDALCYAGEVLMKEAFSSWVLVPAPTNIKPSPGHWIRLSGTDEPGPGGFI